MGDAGGSRGSASKKYMTSRPVASNDPGTVAEAVRAATRDMKALLHSHAIDVEYMDIALLGHSESWDGEGQRWVHVIWGF